MADQVKREVVCAVDQFTIRGQVGACAGEQSGDGLVLAADERCRCVPELREASFHTDGDLCADFLFEAQHVFAESVRVGALGHFVQNGVDQARQRFDIAIIGRWVDEN